MTMQHDPCAPGRRTSAQPRVVDGVTFFCYHAGVLRYAWRSEDGRIEVARNAGRSTTYRASVDGVPIRGTSFNGLARRFLTEAAAMRAAVKAAT